MIVRRFFIKGIAHSSYLIAGSKACAIVDPQRDVGIYLNAAKAMDVEITHILETHLHADFVSGHIDLAEATGAAIYAPKSAQCGFDHVPLAEGDAFEIEHMLVSVLETPGHTPEHIAYVLTDQGRGDDPVALVCGDTLFVGDVGRPDLFPGMARELAAKLYDSLHEKLLKLPDFCEVYPAHGAGSLCGKAMAAKRTSTIGYERRYNPALMVADRETFIASLTNDMPPAPDHFGRCSAINGVGPTPIRDLPAVERLAPQQFHERAQAGNALVLDVRRYESFGGQHVPGAYHNDLAGNFSTFSGWVLPPNQDILLVTEHDAQIEEAAIGLRRVGLDRVVGYLDGGMYAWARRGLPVAHVAPLSVQKLYEIGTSDSRVLVDVRSKSEYDAFHIEGSIHIPVPELRTRHTELDPEAEIVLICNTGRRSSLGASILLRNGFTTVHNVAGGTTGYSAAGYGAECPMCVIPHGPRFLGTARG